MEKKSLKNKRKLSDQNRVYIITTLFVIAGVMLLVVLLSLYLREGKAPADNTTGVSGGVTNEATDTAPTAPESTGGTTDDNAPGTAPDSTAPDETTADDTTDDRQTPAEPMEIGTKKTSDGQGDITIEMIYPEIKSPSPSKYSTEELNEEIAYYMDEQRKNMCRTSPEDAYEYVIESTDITYVGGSFFSAVVVGHFYISASPHPTIFAYAINFDANECRVLSSGELINDFAAVKKSFLDGKFTLKKGMNGLLNETSYEDMFTEYRAEYDIYPGVYYTGDSFGMIIELVFTLDGYALFEIPTGSLGGAVYSPANQ